MYINTVEIYFFEDEKTVTVYFTGKSIEEVKVPDINELVKENGQKYSMLSSEVVVSSMIEGPEGYVDSDEFFCSYDAKPVRGEKIAC